MRVECTKCMSIFDDAHRWTICPHRLLEAASDAPRGTNTGYCTEHDLYGCKFSHEEMLG
jgi:hypothetical protein